MAINKPSEAEAITASIRATLAGKNPWATDTAAQMRVASNLAVLRTAVERSEARQKQSRGLAARHG